MGHKIRCFGTGREHGHKYYRPSCLVGATALAILDKENGVKIHGISDIEFWMHKLFNKVGGYMTNNGFKDLWQKELDKR